MDNSEHARARCPRAGAAVGWGAAVLCLAVSLAAGRAPAEDSGRVLGDVPQTMAPVKIDGVLDEPFWKRALEVNLGVETNPLENKPAPVVTKAYITEDADTLLLAFRAFDPHPGRIRAFLRDRDSAFNDDFVGVVLDTFDDGRRAFEFFANPLGVQMDLTNDDVNHREDASWNAIWKSAGKITAHGYTVEMQIPFSQLRFPRMPGEQRWGIDVLRFYPRSQRARLSDGPLLRGKNCYLCQLAVVRGFADAEPGKDLVVAPEVTVTRADARDAPSGRLAAGSMDTQPGLNLRWGITPDMTANLALNPDFSEIEADVAQLDVNNQFALYFPETRPFFLEGADFFSTPIQAVFTRTVADPDWGAKLTGRSDGNTFGIFTADDAVTDLLFPGPLQSATDALDAPNRASVVRYRRGFGKGSTIGVLVTSRAGGSYSNSLAGVDGHVRVSDRHSFDFQFLHSDTRYPDAIVSDFDQPAGTFGGDGRSVKYGYSSRDWFANADYSSIDPGFRADSGFVTRVDIEQTNVGGGRIWQGDGRQRWNQIRLGATMITTHDHSGALLDRTRQGFVTIAGPRQSFLRTAITRGLQFWDGRLFSADTDFVYAQITPVRGLNVNVSVNVGDQIDFDNSRLGKQLRIQPGIDWNANRHLLLRLRHTSDKLDDRAGKRIFDAELTDARLTWQFNLRSSVRLVVQREHVARNLDSYVDKSTDPHTLTIASQLLYSYKINPQTVFYGGYSDNRQQDLQYPRLTKTGRTFFLKFSYAWVPK